MPATVSAAVTTKISDTNLFVNLKASSLPFFSRHSLNIGIKLADIADAKIASKNTLGILLAVKNALASIPEP